MIFCDNLWKVSRNSHIKIQQKKSLELPFITCDGYCDCLLHAEIYMNMMKYHVAFQKLDAVHKHVTYPEIVSLINSINSL